MGMALDAKDRIGSRCRWGSPEARECESPPLAIDTSMAAGGEHRDPMTDQEPKKPKLVFPPDAVVVKSKGGAVAFIGGVRPPAEPAKDAPPAAPGPRP
jgi:hypothetical protein